MTDTLPKVIHTYQNHILDSPRWRHYTPRDDDIIVATSLKSGTTWMQAILAHLILDIESTPSIGSVSPWLEVRWGDLEKTLEGLEAQEHRRFIKTHLPLGGLPFYPQVKYLVVGRDARDVFMSLWNHHSKHTEEALARFGPSMPHYHDLHAFWRDWMTRGWFAWESEGYPRWGNLRHTQTWWDYRGLENILFVHFNDLLSDLEGEIRRVASFLEIACSDERVTDIAQAVSFASMKQHAEEIMPFARQMWHGGAQTFINKGTNGRWKDVLSPDELALYEQKADEVLTPDCRAWLERGRVALLNARASTAASLEVGIRKSRMTTKQNPHFEESVGS